MTVGWDADPVVASWRGLPSLDGDRTADACVVGLGGSGLAAVETLTERGLSVVGVDAGRVAAGAAGRNGGFLLGGPALFLHDAIARWGAATAVELYRATLRELAALETALGPEVIRRTGSIRLAGLPGDPESGAEVADRERELADCAAHEAALREHGFAVEVYDGPLGRGIFLPDDAAMNPARRALGLATELARHDRAELYEHTAVTRVEAGRVVTERGTIFARTVLVAVDGRLELVLPQLAGRVRTTRLQMLATEPIAPGRLPCPVYGRWGYDYAQQLPDGRLFVGGGRDHFVEDEWLYSVEDEWLYSVEDEWLYSVEDEWLYSVEDEWLYSVDEEWTTGTEPTATVQDYIEHHVARRMAGAAVRVTHRWAASVGYTPDGRPLCAQVDEDVYAVGGYNGTGNLVGPVAARAAVALALDGTAPPAYFAT